MAQQSAQTHRGAHLLAARRQSTGPIATSRMRMPTGEGVAVLDNGAVARRSMVRLAPALLREALLVTALLLVYNAGRLLAATRVTGAFDNAHHLLADERWLHLPHEQTLQAFAIGLPDLARAANSYYAFVHFPLTIGVLVWLWLFRPAHYLWARRSLVGATGAGLLIMALLPTAPPRMMTGYGFVDTGLAFGQSVYGAVGQDKLANQFAALPSLHVGWALLVAVVCISASTSRWRWLWAAHPVLTVLVVVVTGNHYWLDAIVGVALVTGALLLTRGVRRPVVRVAPGWPSTPAPRVDLLAARSGWTPCPRLSAGRLGSGDARD